MVRNTSYGGEVLRASSLRRRRSSWAAIPLVAGLITLAACGSDDDSSSATEAPATTAASGGTDTTAATSTSEGTTADSSAASDPAASTDTSDAAASDDGASVTVGAVLEPTSLDIIHQAGAALDQILLDNVYETLLTTDDSGSIEPGLAELPEVSADGTTYTFTIQEGVTFHDGTPLTSADVVSSLDQLRAEDAVPTEDLASVSTVTAVDDQTVEVTLTEPDNDLMFNLTRRAGAVLQSDATGLENRAVGTGPFALQEWNTGTSITLSRYDEYWGDPAKVASVTFVYFTDANAAVNALTAGDVDVLTGVSSDLVGPLQDDDDFVVSEGTTNGEFTLGFNNGREPFTDVRVRKAVRQAIDKEGVRELYNGFGTIIGGPVPPTDPWYEDLTDVAPYDPEAARALLEAAGHGEGLELTLVWPNIYPISAAEYVASQLSEVGITVEIETVEFSVWLEQVYGNKDYDMTAVLHVEPRDIGNYANPDYYWAYDNPEVQSLINQAKVSPSPDEATTLLKQAARLISEDSPVDWLLLYADLTVARANVTGYPTNDTASRFDASDITVS